MFETKARTARRHLVRLGIMTVVLAPLVTVVLMGLSRLHQDTPEWVYWQAELIFLNILDIVYDVTLSLSLVGALVLGFLFFGRRGRGASQPVVARGLMFSIALLCSLGAAEVVAAGWIAWSHRFTVVPVGGLGSEARDDPSLQFAEPAQHIDLRTDFPDPPDEPRIDLVVLGESSAEGVPYNSWVSIGKIVAWKLQAAIPGRPIDLKVIARSGDTLEKQHQILSNIRRRPDLLIIYCGHNEFYSRLWWARNIDYYALEQRPMKWDVIGETTRRFSSLRALIQETANGCRIAIPPWPDTTRNLVDVPTYTAKEYRLLLTDFRRRLNELVSYAERVGALPILILPPANDADFEPNRSYLPSSTTGRDREEFERDFRAAHQLESVDPATSVDRFRALIARQPCFAETHYRLARLLEQSGKWDEAYHEYVAARDLDGMPMRCLSPFQQAYRQVAARHGCILIDGQSYFHAIGRHGQLGDELFQDAMHPSLRGQIALAQAVLVALRARRAFGWPADSAVPVVDPRECVAHFGIDKNAWTQIAKWCKGFNELMSPMRYDRSLRLEKRAAGIAAVAQINAGIAPDELGLPNLGTPASIPLLEKIPEAKTSGGRVPCLEERSGQSSD
jgi:hypothetical protein